MRPTPILAFVLLSACAVGPPAAPVPGPVPEPVATFSIVARDPSTGDLGVAVQSKFFGVGSVVPWARAGVGAVATQAFANTTYGPEALQMLALGLPPEDVLNVITSRDGGRDRRQVGLVDAKGGAAAFTGREALDWAGHVVGEGYACQGNILAGEAVVKAMAEAFEATGGPLPERLVAALAAGQAAGGDKRGRQSAALLVVREGGGYAGFNDRYVDLRVEDHPTPIEELARLLALHREFFPNVPAPGDLARFAPEPEPAPDAGPRSSPRAAWASFVRLFAARDWEGLRASYGAAYREAHPPEAFAAEMEAAAAGIDSFLAGARYRGTALAGDRAQVAIDHRGGARPILVDLVLEEGEWRFVD